jgi:SsrA-binding protein
MVNYLFHKTALRDYEIIDRYEAGIELLGTEVKSIRAGHGVLAGAHIIIRDGEAYVVGMQVPPYQPKNVVSGYAPDRTRKLLLTKSEIATLAGSGKRAGYTLIPLSVFPKGKKIKLEIGVGKGKKKFDKREDIKKREDARSVRRISKHSAREI